MENQMFTIKMHTAIICVIETILHEELKPVMLLYSLSSLNQFATMMALGPTHPVTFTTTNHATLPFIEE